MSSEKGPRHHRTSKPKDEPRRGGKPKAMAQMVPKLTQTALGKRGLAQANLIVDWPSIVGEEKATTCQPEKLIFPRGQRNNGTLHLRVTSTMALELQHDSPQLIDRINGYFGYAAVESIRLIQTPLKQAKIQAKPRPHRTPELGEIRALEDRLEGIEDAELRETLQRLGTAILSESGESTKN